MPLSGSLELLVTVLGFMSSLVSILTPCFGHESYLEDYFESLREQTYPHIELIFYDDASTDGSWAIAQGYRARLQDRFSRVVMRQNGQNIGLIGTMSLMQSEIKGDIVCFLESDDYLYPTKVEENVAFLGDHLDIGLVHSDVDFLHEKDNRLERCHWRSLGRTIPIGLVFQDLLRDNFILTCTMACRASLLEAHIDFEAYEQREYQTPDYPMFLDLSRHAPFGYIDRSLAVYRVVEGSISHPRSDVDLLKWKVDYYRVKRDYIRQYDCDDEIRRRADSQLHGALMQLGWASGDAATFARGRSWFLEHEPARISGWPQKARSVAVGNRGLWRALRFLEALRARSPAVRALRGAARLG